MFLTPVISHTYGLTYLCEQHRKKATSECYKSAEQSMFRNCALDNNKLLEEIHSVHQKAAIWLSAQRACIVTWPELKATINSLYAWSSSGLG